MKYVFCFIFLIPMIFVSQVLASPPAFVLQGSITKPNKEFLEASHVDFTVQVMSQANECLLYEETFVRNMTSTEGLFKLSIGRGTNTGATSLTLVQALDNSLDNLTGLSCASGSSYDPSSSDTRRLRLTFNDGSGPVTLGQDHIIESVPYAQYAGSLEGKKADDFIQVNTTGAGLSQSHLENIFDNGANQTELLALLNGTSTSYAPLNANGASSLPTFTTGTPPSSTQAGDMWLNTDTGQVMYYDGSSTQAVGAGSGSVTSIVAGSGLDGGTITTTGTISISSGGVQNSHLASGIDAAKITTGTLGASQIPNLDASKITTGTVSNARLDVGTGNNQIVQLNGSAQLPAVDGSLLTNVSGTDTSKLPLSGGNMSGDINLNSNQIINAGHIQQSAQRTVTLGAFTNTQEASLVGTLGAGNAGATWYNSDDGDIKYWDGSAAIVLNTSAASVTSVTATSPLSSSGGSTPDISISLGNGLYNNAGNVDIDLDTDPGLEFNSNKLKAKVGDGLKLTSSGIEADVGTSAGQLVAVDDLPNCNANEKIQRSPGPVITYSCVSDVDTTLSGATAGGDLSGTYPNPTIANDAVTTVKILDNNVTTDKLSSTGIAAGTYEKVTVDVKGRVTGGGDLVAADIPNLDALKITSGNLNNARLPTNISVTSVSASGALSGASASVTGTVSANAFNGSTVTLSNGIRIGSVSTACNGTTEGTIRYNNTGKKNGVLQRNGLEKYIKWNSGFFRYRISIIKSCTKWSSEFCCDLWRRSR